jgi:hypothetical protein
MTDAVEPTTPRHARVTREPALETVALAAAILLDHGIRRLR